LKRVERRGLKFTRDGRERYGTITSQYLADENSVYYLLEQTGVAHPSAAMARG